MESFAAHSAAAIDRLGPDESLAGVNFVVEQHVTDNDGDGDGDEVWHLSIVDGEISVVDGPADAADVTLRQDRDTARALRDGSLHAQHAFLTGRLVIDGDIAKLLEHGDLLAGLLKGARA